MDQLLPHKDALERHLVKRLGKLFALQYDLLLYDITSTYFEGAGDPAICKRGYSRDHRPDCVQLNIALVVTREGFLLGYELFEGNRTDVTTVEAIVTVMEQRYGKADRVWVMDHGMVSGDNVEWLREGDLAIRPIWHQKAARIKAHVLVCFLAYVLWKTLEKWQSLAGLGNSPRRILEELNRIHSTDVVLPSSEDSQHEIRLRCVVRPDKAEAALLDRPGLPLAERLRAPLPMREM